MRILAEFKLCTFILKTFIFTVHKTFFYESVKVLH